MAEIIVPDHSFDGMEPPGLGNYAQSISEEPKYDYDAIPEDERKQLEETGFFNQPVHMCRGTVLYELPREGQRRMFEYAEHSFLGDAIKLTMVDGSQKTAVKHPFKLPSGVELTYGQINGLAGDFYGTDSPICQGSNVDDQRQRFQDAYNTLAEKSSRLPEETNKIIKILLEEVTKVNEALRNHKDPSVVYHEDLEDVTYALEAATFFRKSPQPGYLGLALINLDHFGPDARLAYNAGHLVALEKAKQARNKENKAEAAALLDTAYTLNAFADHFLQDLFSAGHLRVPRRMLHSTSVLDKSKDLCAKKMHDEDNYLGLDVQNLRGNRWTLYGDKRLADKVDAENLGYCKEAVQASADEIYECYKSGNIPDVEEFRAWQIAPTLESANSPSQKCCPLFILEGGVEKMRADINARRVWKHVKVEGRFQGYKWMLYQLSKSPRWKYPMQLDP